MENSLNRVGCFHRGRNHSLVYAPIRPLVIIETGEVI